MICKCSFCQAENVECLKSKKHDDKNVDVFYCEFCQITNGRALPFDDIYRIKMHINRMMNVLVKKIKDNK